MYRFPWYLTLVSTNHTSSNPGLAAIFLACATDETKLWLSPSAKESGNPCCGSPPWSQDFSKRHDWSVKKAIVDLPIRMKGNSKSSSCN